MLNVAECACVNRASSRSNKCGVSRKACGQKETETRLIVLWQQKRMTQSNSAVLSVVNIAPFFFIFSFLILPFSPLLGLISSLRMHDHPLHCHSQAQARLFKETLFELSTATAKRRFCLNVQCKYHGLAY